jgi:hypothetical protein
MHVHGSSDPLRMVGRSRSRWSLADHSTASSCYGNTGNEQPRCCTKYKNYGGALYFMRVALILPPP